MAARRSRSALHPGRLLELFGRAGALGKLAALALFGLVPVGGVLLLLPFSVDVAHPAPPPLTLRLQCPPALVAAVAGAGGLSNPVAGVPELAAEHDRLCLAGGRPRAASGVLFAGAGILNAAAVLEWSRVRRRARRRRRRSAAGHALAAGSACPDSPRGHDRGGRHEAGRQR